MCDGEGEWLRDGCHTLVTALEHVLTVAEQGGCFYYSNYNPRQLV